MAGGESAFSPPSDVDRREGVVVFESKKVKRSYAQKIDSRADPTCYLLRGIAGLSGPRAAKNSVTS
jgi:hypothetical protein